MPMYKLTPTFPPNFEVHPKIACYPVGSYHNPSFGGVGPSDAVQVESDPRKALEHKQLSLIEQLKAQTEELKKLLVSLGEAGKAERSAQKPAEKAPKEPEKSAGAASSAPGVPGAPAKLDKDAKKEARKAAKAEAVKKLASGEAPPQKSAKKTVNSTPWTVQDDRKTWETNLTLTVNLPTSLVAYEPQEQLKNATLTVRDVDLPWARALAKVGASRGVSFEGEVKNQTKEKKSSLKVVKGPAPSLQLEKTTVKSLQTIWKLLGSSLGLFSRRPQQVLSASHQAIWLGKAEQILAGSCDQSFVTREASQFLARFDSLSSQWEVCVADIVFRSLLNLGEHLPNNVELWAKKIDALIV